MSTRLRIILSLITLYLAVLGILFLFLPSIAQKVVSSPLPDKGLNMLYGQLVLTFAYTAFLAARGGHGLTKLSRLVLVLTLGHVVIFAYQLATGLMTFAQVGPPLIVNAVFTILLFLFRRDIHD